MVRRLTRPMDEQIAQDFGVPTALASQQVLLTFIGKTGSTDEVRISGTGGPAATYAITGGAGLTLTFPQTDDFANGDNAIGSIQGQTEWGLEGHAGYP